jgi:ribokinase
MIACDCWLSQLEIPLETISYLAQKALDWDKKLILNPAPAQTLPDSVYQKLFLITPNETEASALTGISCDQKNALPEIANWFFEKGVQNVLVTLGDKGVFFKNSTQQLEMPAFKVNVIDTTAAGDVFNGTLAVAIAEDLSWEAAIQTASKAASISVTRMGAQNSAPYRREVVW